MTKYIAISLNDEKAKDIAEIISNKTSKKILNALTENEMSETDLSKSLSLPLNTIGYNIKKLKKAGLIEKSKNFFWSTRGKKIPTYKLANKSILISTKQKIKGILPAAVLSFIGAIGIKLYFSLKESAYMAKQSVLNRAEDAVSSAGAIPEAIQKVPEIASSTELLWLFFLLGSITALLVFLILNFWRKNGN